MASDKTQVLLDAFANASAESRKPYTFPGLESVFDGRSGYTNPHAYVRSVQKCLSLKEGTEKGEWCELANKFLEWKCAHPGEHLPAKAILDKVANSAVRESRIATRPAEGAFGEPSASSGSVTIDQATFVQFMNQQKEQMALFQQAFRTPLAIEDGSGCLTRVENKLDAVRDAAIQSLVDNSEEHGLEDEAIERLIENDEGALEEKAIQKMIADDDGDLEKQATQKLTQEERALLRRQKRRIEGLEGVIKRMRTEAKTAPMPGEVISALLANEQWRQEVVAQVTADVTGGEVVSALLANGQWRQETIAQVVDDETAREEMIDALAVSHRAQVREELELDSQEDSELEADEVDE